MMYDENGCTICDKSYEVGETFEAHVKKHSHKKNKKKLFCNICKDQCPSSIEFIRHTVSAKHKNALEKLESNEHGLFCGLCHVQCLTQSQFCQHMISKGHIKKVNLEKSDHKKEVLDELIKLITTVLDNEHFPYEEGLKFIKKVNLDLVVLIDQCHITNNLTNIPIKSSTDAVDNDEKCNNLDDRTSNGVIIETTEQDRSSVNNDKVNEKGNEINNSSKTDLSVEATVINEKESCGDNWKHQFTLDNIQDIPKLLAALRMEIYYQKLMKADTKRIGILQGLENFVNLIHTNAVPDTETLTFLVKWNYKLQKIIKSGKTILS